MNGDGKKQLILDAAAKLFLEKGFQSTSTQDIAEASNVSKATIYKYFTSKEELGIQVSFYLTESLLYNIQKLAGLSDRERLTQAIITRMVRFEKRSSFTEALLLAFPPEQRESHIKDMNRGRFRISAVFAELVSKAFDIEDEGIAWELAINLNGLVKEISFVQEVEKRKIEPEHVADFIIDSLEAVYSKRKGRPAFFTKEKIAELRGYFEEGDTRCKPYLERKQLLKELRQLVNERDVGEKEKYVEAMGFLEKEYEKTVPRAVMLDAMLTYLESEETQRTIYLLRELDKRE